jgi:iron(III) transport system ATP-binding protein
VSLYLEHVTQQFGTTLALNDINLTINDGEFMAILGPSGCGKTTLLRAIAGFQEPTAGVIRMDKEIYSGEGRMVPVEDRNLGMVFQSFALWPHMTVREHVEFPLKSKRCQFLSADDKKKMVDRTINAMGLTAYEHRFPSELSGGQRQRVSMARAIVRKPSILLMDEPLSALDAELKISMRKEIQDLHQRTGATVIYVTHDQSEALAMADRILVMRSGQIEQLGTPEEIYCHPKTEFVATFVSKCNLVQGHWNGDAFSADGCQVTYDGKEIPGVFRQKGIFPVRPEQFKICFEGSGLDAVITNKQYSGREIQYSLLCNHRNVTVYASSHEQFKLGDQVKLVYTA